MTELDKILTPSTSSGSKSTTCSTHDLNQYSRRLAENLYSDADVEDYNNLVEAPSNLFSGQGNIEMWTRTESDSEAFSESIFDPSQVDDLKRDRVYFVNQATSWSPLQTSSSTLLQMLKNHEIFPIFLEMLFSFGAKKTDDDDPYFNVCYQQDDSTSLDICYLLRFYEKHNRPNLKNPWSLRQMGVYQKYHKASATSVWIFIKPFQKCKETLRREFSGTRSLLESLRIHSLLIDRTLHGWRWYLNDRRRDICVIAEKATYSSLGPKPHDYKTGFDDVQRLQLISNSLSLSHNILHSVLQIITMIQNISEASASAPPEPDIRVTNPLNLAADGNTKLYVSRNLLPKTQSYIRTTEALQQAAGGASELLSRLLQYRKADDSSSLTHTLTTLSAQGNTQTGQLKTLTEEAKRDTRAMSILAVIATVYIPANLIASIFSSGLVQFPSHADATTIKLLEIQSSMWVYILSSVILSGINVAVAYLWMYNSGSFANSPRRFGI